MSLEKRETSTRLKAMAIESPPSRFLDYRLFFLNLKQNMDQEFGRYTYAQFSSDLGFQKPHVAYILTNHLRRLSSSYLVTIESKLQLPSAEKKYLRTLVDYTHAKDSEDRQRQFQKLVVARKGTVASDQEMNELKFFTNWRHAAIFEMFDLNDFRSDPLWISQQFVKPLTLEQVEESLQLLQELGLVARDDNGVMVKTRMHVKASESITALAKAGFHLQMMEKAKESLSIVTHTERELSALTMTISEKHFARLKEDLQLFKRYAFQLSELSESKDRVVQLNFQLFPLTKAASNS